MANTKSNGAGMAEEKSTSGMMPDGIASGVSAVGGILKKTGATTAMVGSAAKVGIPAILLVVAILPTLLAPFSLAINVGIYAFIGCAVLKRVGVLPATRARGRDCDRDALSDRRRQAMGATPETDMAHR